MQLSGNTVLVTGGGTGIGRGLAEAFHRLGNNVVIAGRRHDTLQAVAKANPGMQFLSLDQGDSANIRRFAIELSDNHPDLNVLIPMAGIMRIEDWHRPDGFLASAESVIASNLLGPIRLIAAFIEHLRAQQAATIVTVSSGLAFTPLAATPSYSAAKAAIHLLSEAIRLQYADTSVQVIELEPPSVQTGLVPGQETNELAMPLDEFISEAVGLLGSEPEAKEIQVERVKFLRYGEARGDYDQVVATLNATDPHGK